MEVGLAMRDQGNHRIQKEPQPCKLHSTFPLTFIHSPYCKRAVFLQRRTSQERPKKDHQKERERERKGKERVREQFGSLFFQVHTGTRSDNKEQKKLYKER